MEDSLVRASAMGASSSSGREVREESGKDATEENGSEMSRGLLAPATTGLN